jgi:intein-encoded DNA endonuclease-like protein
MRYTQKRIYSLSNDAAYTVGLITSDGCLSKDGRHIDLTSNDIDQLENFSKALGRNLRISPKNNNSQTQAFRVQFSDVAYYDFLVSLGITPAKSKTIEKVDIPDKFYPDFLRGLFDGDGSTYSYYDPRWKSSFMFYVCFSSANLDFIKFIQLFNKNLIGLSGGSIRHSAGAYTLAYAKADSHKIYHYMYYNKDIICLNRKKAKLQSFMATDRTDIIN